MNDGQALIVQGDALHLPLPDASVDMICMSPPFWALRAYSAGPGEIGSEATPAEYLEMLWAATAECVRVLKPTGSMFVDLGDKYAGQSGINRGSSDGLTGRGNRPGTKACEIPAKSLMLLPERYRVGCVDQTSPHYRAQFYQQLADDLMDYSITPERARQLADEFEASPKSKGLGLICRSVIVWDKPNGLPESVTDRPRRSHEDWVMLVKQPRYYSATDEIREPHVVSAEDRAVRSGANPFSGQKTIRPVGPNSGAIHPLGKLPGSVWTIPSEPLRLPEHLGVQHYAAFPSEWPRRLILGFSPPGICVECGHGRVPVVERQQDESYGRSQRGKDAHRHNGDAGWGMDIPGAPVFRQTATILGYACSCTPHTDHPGSGESSGPRSGNMLMDGDGWPSFPDTPGPPTRLNTRPRSGPWREYHLDRWTPPPTRPAIILDPFAGTGTTPMVARALGRIGVGVDLSHAYCRAARWRVKHDGAKAINRTNLERQTTLL